MFQPLVSIVSSVFDQTGFKRLATHLNIRAPLDISLAAEWATLAK